MNIKTFILSAVLASSSIFASEPHRLTAENLESHNRLLQASTSAGKIDIDQRSNPSTIAAGKEALPIARTVEHSNTIANARTVESSAGESSWSLSGIGKSILNQVSSPAKKLGSFLVEKTAKHGALIAVEAGLTKLTLNMALPLLQKKVSETNSEDVMTVAVPALFLGSQTLLSSLLLENTHRHFISTPIFKLASVGFQAAYMMGICSGEAALIASGINLLYMLFGEAERPDF